METCTRNGPNHSVAKRGNTQLLYHTISYYIILYYIRLYHTISYYIILHHTISYYIILYHTISYYIILYHTISYYIIIDIRIYIYCYLYHLFGVPCVKAVPFSFRCFLDPQFLGQESPKTLRFRVVTGLHLGMAQLMDLSLGTMTNDKYMANICKTWNV